MGQLGFIGLEVEGGAGLCGRLIGDAGICKAVGSEGCQGHTPT